MNSLIKISFVFFFALKFNPHFCCLLFLIACCEYSSDYWNFDGINWKAVCQLLSNFSIHDKFLTVSDISYLNEEVVEMIYSSSVDKRKNVINIIKIIRLKV